MRYKISLLVLTLILTSCVNIPVEKKEISTSSKSYFLNKGFTLIYNENLYKNNVVKSKIENRSLIIYQKNLKKNTSVKVTNLINLKYAIVKVGKNVQYPYFYNSVISARIAKELEINELEPYIEIKQIIDGSSFVVKKAKTYEEEKNVAEKAPIDDIQIKNLNKKNKKELKTINNKFSYIIKIADFYFKNSADQMKSRITSETTIKKVNIIKLSNTNFRVFLGPFNNLSSLKNSFNAINVLEFDSIEIIKK